MANVTRQQTRYMTRAEFDALDKTTVDVGTEICIVDQIQKEDLSTDLQNAITSAEGALPSSGGTISGNLAITGNLTVSGTTTSESEKKLMVEANVIATNANKVDLQTLLSGLAINKNANSTYGIMYDPTDDTVKFGEGVLDDNGKFTFNENEGHPLAIRADSSLFTDAHLVKWDEASMSFVDAGVSADSFSKKIKTLDLSYGASTVTYDTTDGIQIKGQTRVTYADNTFTDVGSEVEVPIIAGDGLIMDAVTDNTKARFKLDPEHSVYLEGVPTDENAVPVFAKSSKSWISLPTTPSASASSLVSRDADGRFQAGAPQNDGDVAIKSYVDAIGPASTVLAISAPGSATNGTLTEAELATLQSSDNASIMFNHKKYYLGGKGHQEGYLTYTHSGYENNLHILESITITISTRAWVLNSTDVLDRDEITELVTPMIPTVPDAPTWKTTAPTTEVDKKKVQFTKVIISTTDDTNFPGMNGKHAIVPGFTNDGFHYGTVVCSQADPAYEFPFIGSITSEMASGTIIKPSVAPTYISVVDPAITFSYEYLW